MYHQCKELQRVLQWDGQYRVRLEYRGDFPPADTTDDKALHIFLPAHEVRAFPPHYILYQTEQTTHPCLNHTNPFWPPSRNGSRKQTMGEAFEVIGSCIYPIPQPHCNSMTGAKRGAPQPIWKTFSSSEGCLHLPSDESTVQCYSLGSGHCNSAHVQGAIEVWEYSMRQINIFKQSQLGGQKPIKFRHVPFSWFPVVRTRLCCPSQCSQSRDPTQGLCKAPSRSKMAAIFEGACQGVAHCKVPEGVSVCWHAECFAHVPGAV